MTELATIQYVLDFLSPAHLHDLGVFEDQVLKCAYQVEKLKLSTETGVFFVKGFENDTNHWKSVSSNLRRIVFCKNGVLWEFYESKKDDGISRIAVPFMKGYGRAVVFAKKLAQMSDKELYVRSYWSNWRNL